MAQKRMFNLKIIDSAKFLKMPLSSQLLYFHLCMRCDDDGVVEGYNILKMTGINEDDLRVLTSKGFIKILNDDLVAYITDWREHNTIRADRKVDSIYKELLLQIMPEINLLERKNKNLLTGKCLTSDGQVTDKCLTSDGQVSALTGSYVCIEQNRLEQNRLEQISIEQQQIMKMLNCSQAIAEKIINAINESNYSKNVVVVVSEKLEILKNGNFKNMIGALITAIREDWKLSEAKIKELKFNNFESREYDYDNLERKLLGWDNDD